MSRMKVQFSDNAFMPGPRAAGAAPKPAAKDFASVLAKVSTAKETDVPKTADTVKKTAAGVGKATGQAGPENHPGRVRTPAAPKTEKTEDVAGHAYDEIVAGPRNGMMLNQSGNARHGRAFVLVERDGRSFHIYGSGKDRKIFEVGHDPKPEKASKTTPSARTGATVARP